MGNDKRNRAAGGRDDIESRLNDPEDRIELGLGFSAWRSQLAGFARPVRLEPWAAEHFAPALENTPLHYRGWLRHLIEAYSRCAERNPSFRAAVDAGNGPDATWLECPGGEVGRTGVLLARICKHGLTREVLITAAGLHEPGESYCDLSSLFRILPAGGATAITREGLSHPDPTHRILAAQFVQRVAHWEVMYFNTRAVIEADRVCAAAHERASEALVVLLDDRVPQVRWEAALALAHYPPAAPRVAAVLTEAVLMGSTAGYKIDKGNTNERKATEFIDALTSHGADVRWVREAAVPIWLKRLKDDRLPSLTRAAAADAIGSLGVVAVEILQLLDSFTRAADRDLGRAAENALWQLTRALAEGRAFVPGRPDEVFLASIYSEPTDTTTRLVYADWLDENGYPREAAYVRAEASDPAGAEAELVEAMVLDPAWVKWWSGVSRGPRCRPQERSSHSVKSTRRRR